MVVRLVERHEADAAYRLRLEALAQDPYAFGATFDEESGLKETDVEALFAPTESSFVMGAFDEADVLVGMVGLRRQKGGKRRHSGQIWGLYVRECSRGQGLAKTLMSETLEVVRTRGDMVQVTLGASTVAEPAKALYRSLGFRTYGIEPDAHRQDGRSFDMEFMVYVFGDHVAAPSNQAP